LPGGRGCLYLFLLGFLKKTAIADNSSATSFSSAWLLIRRYLLLDRGGPDTLPSWLLFLPPALLLGQALMRKTGVGERFSELSLGTFALIYGAVWAFAMAMMPLGYRPFIYFQF